MLLRDLALEDVIGERPTARGSLSIALRDLGARRVRPF
jgi:hypothetical protein